MTPAFLTAATLLMGAPDAAALELLLDPLRLGRGSVFFDSQAWPCPDLPERLTEVGQIGEFTVWQEPEAEEPSPGDRGAYTTYLLYFQRPDDAMTCFRVTATPQGDFDDQTQPIDATITDDQKKASGRVVLTVHNTDTLQHYLSVAPLESPAPVSLSGDSQIWLRLQKVLPNLRLTIDEDKIEVLSPQEALLGQSNAQLPDSGVLRSQAMRALGIKVVVTPVPLRALERSILRTSSEFHEELTVRVPYRTPGGFERVLDVPVKIRFQPSFWALAGGVILGALVGSPLPLLRKDRPKTTPRRRIGQWARAALVAIILALVAECLGIVLGGKLTILRFSLDPYQLLPACLIGVFVGAFGFKGLEALLRVLPDGNRPSPPTAGEASQ